MDRLKVGLVLLIVGAALLLASGITFTTQEKTKLGPVTIEHPEEHRVPYMPVAGAILAVTGGILMITGRARGR